MNRTKFGSVIYLKGGFPHSEIPGSKSVDLLPGLIAACHVLHRLQSPRHSPDALQNAWIHITRRVKPYKGSSEQMIHVLQTVRAFWLPERNSCNKQELRVLSFVRHWRSYHLDAYSYEKIYALQAMICLWYQLTTTYKMRSLNWCLFICHCFLSDRNCWSNSISNDKFQTYLRCIRTEQRMFMFVFPKEHKNENSFAKRFWSVASDLRRRLQKVGEENITPLMIKRSKQNGGP